LTESTTHHEKPSSNIIKTPNGLKPLYKFRSEQKILRWVAENKPDLKIEAIFTERSPCQYSCNTKLSLSEFSKDTDVYWAIPEAEVMFGESVRLPTVLDGTAVTWKNNREIVAQFLVEKFYPTVVPAPGSVTSIDVSGQV
jgi:hypothetical protein